MTYVVLARKWRPQQFADVLGQEHVTQTLTNAITSDRIAHAFLFSGPRGVGKTSAARILAKALCCEEQDGPTATPCGKCGQCIEITEGRSTDVFEIDAASHTGVDNVREIIDNVRYLPSKARFKIYVIDEVHMLSVGAFNALLKTLEEPPPHVKFVLATTDPHKVPVTILSRCQRYDFRRIALSRIAERLSFILSQEGVEHDPSALTLVAREAEGSMRDAQSLLEQVLAYAGPRRLDAQLVRDALGVVDAALVSNAVDAVLERRPGDVIQVVSDVHERGLDLSRFADALVEHVRDLLVARLVKSPPDVLDRPSDEIDALVTRAKSIPPQELQRVFEQLCNAVEELGRAAHPRFVLEVQLATIAEAPARVPVEALMEQLGRVEAQLAGGPPPPSPPRGGGGGGGRPQQQPRQPQQHQPRQPPPQRSAPHDAPPPPQQQQQRAAPPPEEEPPHPADAASSARAEVANLAASVPERFRAFVDMVKKNRPPLAATLVQVRPLTFEKGNVVLGCETAFDQRKLEDADTKKRLESLLSDYFGAPTQLTVQRGAGTPVEQPATIDEVTQADRRAVRQEKERVARSNPAVKAIEGQLGGEIARVRVIDEGS